MLTNGSFKKIAVKASGNGVRNASELKKAYLHVQLDAVYLLTHIQTINETGREVPMHGMRCVTYLTDASRFDSFEQITGGYIHGVTIEILHDADSIAAVHGSANKRAGPPPLPRPQQHRPRQSRRLPPILTY